MLKSKIHRATVTDADLTYEGSISIDPKLCELTDIITEERVEVYNCNSGSRIATYVIPGKDGEICLNGAAARHFAKGDVVIICSYSDMSDEEARLHKAKVILVDENNRPK